MQFTTAALLTCLAAASQAFVIPEGLADGVYTVDVDNAGNAAVQPIGTTLRRGLPSPQVGGDTSKRINPHGDMDAAARQLQAWCNDGGNVNGGSHKMFVSGVAVAYVCSYGGQNPCSSAEWGEAVSLWNAENGLYAPSWVWIQDWKKTYGQDLAGASICNNGAGTIQE